MRRSLSLRALAPSAHAAGIVGMTSYFPRTVVSQTLLERADGFGWAARRLQAEIHEARGDLVAARAAYDELVQLDPSGPTGKLARAARVRVDPHPDAQLHL